jgi:hypothetical protein
MLKRFLAASGVAALGIALGAGAILLFPALARAPALPVLWCFAPLAWGLWAMCAPDRWVPQRFPNWGAILGLMAGVLAAFVLNLPSQVRGELVPARLRIIAVGVMVVVYYLLWMLVRAIYRRLAASEKGSLTLERFDRTRQPWPATEARAQTEPGPLSEHSALQVHEARHALQDLRSRLQKHPEVNEAIERLETALNALTISTGGML